MLPDGAVPSGAVVLAVMVRVVPVSPAGTVTTVEVVSALVSNVTLASDADHVKVEPLGRAIGELLSKSCAANVPVEPAEMFPIAMSNSSTELHFQANVMRRTKTR